MHVTLFTNVSKSQISEDTTHFHIEGVPVTVDGAVMNGIRYPAEHNEQGMETIKDRIVTLSHPTTNDGKGADAYAGESLQKFFSGGHITDKYRKNGVWHVNISIKKAILKIQDGGQDFYNKLANKEAVGVSTGLYTEVTKNAGKTDDGIEYIGDATKQQYNHLAMLPNSEPPAGGDATFMRFNSADGEQDMIINVDEFVSKEPESTETIIETQNETLFNKLMVAIKSLAKNDSKPQQTEENNAMSKDDKVKALKAKGSFKDNMSDEEINAAYAKIGADTESKDKADNSELLQAINALNERFDGLESRINEQADAEKTNLVEKVNALETGIDEADLKLMSVNSLNALVNKHQPEYTQSLNSGLHADSSDDLYSDIPEG